MNKEKFLTMFDMSSFEGHEIKYINDYYAGKPWHTSHTFTVDGVELDLEEYYSQAYMPFDKRKPEIATVSIKNDKNKGIDFGMTVTPDHLIKYEDLKELISAEEPQIEGFKYGDAVEIIDSALRRGEEERVCQGIRYNPNHGIIKSLNLQAKTLLVKYGNPLLPTMQFMQPWQIKKIER